MSLATNASGGVVSRQEFDPWGSLRSGSISQTALNYTGQRRDGTGLLYYHARYYDPVLARFLSADTIVPGAPDGSMDGVALKPLTVDVHETGFVTELNAEHGQGFWFQNTDQIAPWGPANPQGLNRYAYVQNNPLRYTDPSGHWTIEIDLGAALMQVFGIRGNISVALDGHGNIALLLTAGGGAAAGGKATLTTSVTVSSAATVSDLQGIAVQLGGEAAALLGAGLEAGAFRDLKGRLQGAFSIGLKAGVALEIHGTATKTWMIGQVNIQRNILNPIKRTLQRAFGGI